MKSETAQGGGRRLLWPAIATAIAFAILMALGTWQVERLKWKLELIERVEQRPGLAPVDLPPAGEWPLMREAEWDYRPVTVTGRFLPAEAYYYLSLGKPNGLHAGPGYFVYAPFEIEGEGVVMVNRGFVPEPMRQPESRPQSAVPQGEVTLTGLWRRDERGNMLTVEPDRAKNIWFVREAPEMAASLGVTGVAVAPFTIDLVARHTPPGGLPQAGETIMTFTNNHLQYVVTWYGLGAALIAVFIVFARGERRKGRS
ncbi:SURF1 family protein [Stappia sp. MMSF_3263]|uniref:SURF1 family protein n=1 Tax=Stappia sp. MMSF_3263 TaxID=3046693 RepID=UPI00273E7822|nr:SURF1 family protein [Stappia sp. MMSF_3263]